jgi:hypothetical protein
MATEITGDRFLAAGKMTWTATYETRTTKTRANDRRVDITILD